MTDTFKFNLDGNLVKCDPGDPDAMLGRMIPNSSIGFLAPPAPPSLPLTIEYLTFLRKQMDDMIGIPPTHFDRVMMNPGGRTAAAIDMLRANAAARQQLNFFGNAIEMIADPLVPATKTVRTQVRFPRSKKKRIRKKWAADPRNWRTTEEPVMWLVNIAELNRKTFGVIPPPKFRDKWGEV